MSIAQKLDKLFEKEIHNNLRDLVIMKVNGSRYELFFRFRITINDSSHVKVYDMIQDSNHEFTSLKTAVTWCILQKHNKHSDASSLSRLDAKLTSLRIENKNFKRLRNLATDDRKFIYDMKLHEGGFNIKMIHNDIDKYVTQSIKLQQLSFSLPRKRRIKSINRLTRLRSF